MKKPSSLHTLLLDYPATTLREKEARSRMLDLLERVEDPFGRTTVAPGHFTASSFVLNPTSDRVLLIRHRTLGLWLQPGGHFEESDEDLEDAARREVLEETGIGDLEELQDFPGLFDIDIHSIPANPKRGEPAHQHFDLRLAFIARSDRITVCDEVIDARWVPLGDVAALGSDESVLRCTRRLQPNNESFSGSTQLL